jgi:DNA-binding CsgD family transcriptional regulator
MPDAKFIKRKSDATCRSARIRCETRNPKGRERRNVETFVRSLYLPRSEEDLRRTIIADILKIVPGQNAVVHTLDFKRRTVKPILPAHPFSRVFLEGIKRFIHEHPSFSDLRKSPRARLISDFIGPREWHSMALYNEAYRPEGLEDQIGVRTCLSGAWCTGVAVLRDRRGFSLKERKCMSLLIGHFEQAFLNARALEKLRLSLGETQAQLDVLPCGTILIDQKLQVLAINARARALEAEFFPGERMNSRLPLMVQSWLHSRTELHSRSFKPLNSLVLYSEDGRLTIQLVSLPNERLHLLVLERRSRRLSPRDFHHLGLTNRESEVLLWLAQGKTNREIASILGGSQRTIDKHVQNLLAKLNLENRAAAILLVADLLLT